MRCELSKLGVTPWCRLVGIYIDHTGLVFAVF